MFGLQCIFFGLNIVIIKIPLMSIRWNLQNIKVYDSILHYLQDLQNMLMKMSINYLRIFFYTTLISIVHSNRWNCLYYSFELNKHLYIPNKTKNICILFFWIKWTFVYSIVQDLQNMLMIMDIWRLTVTYSKMAPNW